jgi:hypothetical protein
MTIASRPGLLPEGVGSASELERLLAAAELDFERYEVVKDVVDVMANDQLARTSIKRAGR